MIMMMTRAPIAKTIAAALAGLMLALVAGEAMSQTPIMDDPLDDRSRRRLDNMEKVMRELRSIVFQGRNTGVPVVVQSAETESLIQILTQRVNDLELSLRRMTSDSETVTRDLEMARRDLAAERDRNAALESRLTSLEAKVAAGVAPPPLAEAGSGSLGTLPAGAAPGAPAQTATAAFDAANRLLLEGDYGGAESAFAAFIEQYPNHARTPEANYRLGQTLTARKATADAAGAYIAAIRGYPKTGWAPEAMLELSRSLVTMGDAANACKVLADLNTRYPAAPAPVKSRAATTRAQARCA